MYVDIDKSRKKYVHLRLIGDLHKSQALKKLNIDEV